LKGYQGSMSFIVIGAMSTTLHIRVFSYRGHTRIALKAD
jgi:hypothetical protein